MSIDSAVWLVMGWTLDHGLVPAFLFHARFPFTWQNQHFQPFVCDIHFCGFAWQKITLCVTKHHVSSDEVSIIASICMEIHFFHYFLFCLMKSLIFKIWQFEIRHECQKMQSVGTPNWWKTKWHHFVIQNPGAPYNWPHSNILYPFA